jgi:hypothetical protein
MLEFVLRKESTSGCGPNENDEPIEPQWRELHNIGGRWMGNVTYIPITYQNFGLGG